MSFKNSMKNQVKEKSNKNQKKSILWTLPASQSLANQLKKNPLIWLTSQQTPWKNQKAVIFSTC